MTRRVRGTAPCRTVASQTFDLALHVDTRGRVQVAVGTGALVALTCSHLHALIAQIVEGGGLLVLDLRCITCVDEAGIAALVQGRRALGRRLSVVATAGDAVHIAVADTAVAENLTLVGPRAAGRVDLR